MPAEGGIRQPAFSGARKSIRCVIPKYFQVSVREYFQHLLKDILRAAGFLRPLMNQQPRHQRADSPGAMTAFAVFIRIARSFTSDQFST